MRLSKLDVCPRVVRVLRKNRKWNIFPDVLQLTAPLSSTASQDTVLDDVPGHPEQRSPASTVKDSEIFAGQLSDAAALVPPAVTISSKTHPQIPKQPACSVEQHFTGSQRHPQQHLGDLLIDGPQNHVAPHDNYRAYEDCAGLVDVAGTSSSGASDQDGPPPARLEDSWEKFVERKVDRQLTTRVEERKPGTIFNMQRRGDQDQGHLLAGATTTPAPPAGVVLAPGVAAALSGAASDGRAVPEGQPLAEEEEEPLLPLEAEDESVREKRTKKMEKLRLRKEKEASERKAKWEAERKKRAERRQRTSDELQKRGAGDSSGILTPSNTKNCSEQHSQLFSGRSFHDQPGCKNSSVRVPDCSGERGRRSSCRFGERSRSPKKGTTPFRGGGHQAASTSAGKGAGAPPPVSLDTPKALQEFGVADAATSSGGVAWAVETGSSSSAVENGGSASTGRGLLSSPTKNNLKAGGGKNGVGPPRRSGLRCPSAGGRRDPSISKEFRSPGGGADPSISKEFRSHAGATGAAGAVPAASSMILSPGGPHVQDGDLRHVVQQHVVRGGGAALPYQPSLQSNGSSRFPVVPPARGNRRQIKNAITQLMKGDVRSLYGGPMFNMASCYNLLWQLSYLW